jgi:hypothetical protein
MARSFVVTVVVLVVLATSGMPSAAAAAAPPWATALCRDGTYFSTNHLRTCSGYGRIKHRSIGTNVVVNREAHRTDGLAWFAAWAEILTFLLLIVGGVVGFLTRINHGLHVSSFPVWTDPSEMEKSGKLGVVSSVQFTNTRPTIALRLQTERFDVRISGWKGGQLTEMVYGPPFPVDEATPQYLAPGEDNRTTSRSPMWISASDLVQVVLWWEFSYGRQSRAMWGMRRSVSGSTVLGGPVAEKGGHLSVPSMDWEGPPRDRWLVPFTVSWWKTRWRPGGPKQQEATGGPDQPGGPDEPGGPDQPAASPKPRPMRVAEVLSKRYGKPFEDAWITANCPACKTANNLGSAQTEIRGAAFVYLCGKCGADVIGVQPAGGGDYSFEMRPGFGIQVPPKA